MRKRRAYQGERLAKRAATRYVKQLPIPRRHGLLKPAKRWALVLHRRDSVLILRPKLHGWDVGRCTRITDMYVILGSNYDEAEVGDERVIEVFKENSCTVDII